MKTKWYCLLYLGLLLTSCQQDSIDMGMIAPYYPSTPLLKQGIVSKFYEHYTPKNKDRVPYTDISYFSYQLDSPHWLTVNKYDAGMELISHHKYEITNKQWILKDMLYYNKGDTTTANITDNIVYDWTNQQALAGGSMPFSNDNTNIFTSQQLAIIDTLIDEVSCKYVKKNEILTTITPQKDTTKFKYFMSTTFAPDLGMYTRHIEYDQVVIDFELVEQMSLNEFEKRTNHGKKRMAYIDPNNTMDDHSHFKLCNHESKIGDYYNCDYRGELRGGKGSWWRVLKKSLDQKKLKKESGFLTYRFIINCKGKAGRFTTEQSNLNFEKKTFDKETVQHLYEIVSSQTDWQVCTGGRVDTQDAYTYITFKLKDGKIIDLLP